MKREFLLVLIVLIVAVSAVFVLLSPVGGPPLACFMHGGSSSAQCR